MPLRVTQSAITNRTQLNFQISQARLSKLTAQLSTGQRLLRPSDDPIDSARIRTNRASDLRFDAHLQTITESTSILERSAGALRDARTITTRATEIALEAQKNGGVFPEVRATLAQEVESLLGDMELIANRRLADGRFLFSGTASSTTPFVAQNNNSGLRYEYQGADEVSESIVGDDDVAPIFIPGEQAFQPRERGDTVFTPLDRNAITGAASGTGTDSGTGQGTLLVQHTLTVYDPGPGSGIAAGASSAAEDTVLGTIGTHTVTINDTSGTGASGTISLNGGPAVAWTSADTDLQVDGGPGETVFVDMSTITAGFAGSVDITSDGELSTDNGTMFTAINFAANNQVVTNTETDEVTFIDSTGIRLTGSDQLDYQGTYDVFQVLIALRDDLRNENLEADHYTANITRRLAELERVQDGMVETMGDVAYHAERLQSLQTRVEDIQFEVQNETLELEQVDFAGAVVSLQSEENVFQIGLAMAGRINNLSLLDFLG